MMTVTRERFRSATVGQLEEVIERRERSHRGTEGAERRKREYLLAFFSVSSVPLWLNSPIPLSTRGPDR